ncbi:Protein of unknown function [Bacillus mycoides]|uniref:Uncharacterized protein n=1 Tax=Bacillus mycoides TaxID=1405 RepID=A0A1G4EID2_BACMY|nr:Protein of unknown function [Bacillus mycoides]
MLSVALTEY